MFSFSKYFSNVNWELILIASFIIAFFLINPSHAANLPWEDGIDKLVKSIKGPVATGICIAGIVGVGGGLAFGGELSQFMKTAIILVSVVCLIIGASSFLSAVGPEQGSGAAVPGFVEISQTVTLK